MKVTFLGTGTSHGVPMIGCDCAVCRSDDPRDRRYRSSIYVETDDGLAILVDTGPDLRSQALAHRVRHLDAVLYTHSHADHILGLDEIRRFNAILQSPLPCYGDEPTVTELRRMFRYVFDPNTARGGGLPEVKTFTLKGAFCLGRQEIQPIELRHGQRTIYGYRFGSFAYLTDCNAIPDASWPLLDGVDVLVLDALRIRPHPTHFSLGEAIEATRRIGPRQAYFTHICHDLPHAATCASLPDGMQLAYDGLIVECR